MVIIPSDQLTLTEKARLRRDAREGGLARMAKKMGVGVTELYYRHAQNIADFGTVGRETWLTATLAAINTPYSGFTTLAAPAVGLTPALANNKLAVFYAASILTAPNPVSLLSFRKGATAGTTLAVYDLEQIEAQLVTEGYLSEAVPYDPQDVLNIVVTSKIATGAQCALILSCYIIEPKGTTVS